MKKFADRKRGSTPTFQIGDKVMLRATNYPSIRPSRKLGEKRYGPFKIIEKVSDLNYRLNLPLSWSIHPVFHISELRKYHEDPENPNFAQPPPDLIEGKEEYEVEKILDAQERYRQGTRKKALHFLVKWKGYHSKEATWEPLENLKNSQELIDDFYKEDPSKTLKLTKKRQVQVLGAEKVLMVEENDFKPLENDTDVTTWPGNNF